MNFEHTIVLLELLTILEGVPFVQNSHVQIAKLNTDVTRNSEKVFADVRRVHTNNRYQNRFSSRRRSEFYFSAWTSWSRCDHACKKHRERYCKVKRKCGFARHIEETRCLRCTYSLKQQDIIKSEGSTYSQYPVVNINQMRLPVLKEFNIQQEAIVNPEDFHVLKDSHHTRRKKPLLIDVDDYEDLVNEDEIENRSKNIHSLQYIRMNELRHRSLQGLRHFVSSSELAEYDDFEYEDLSHAYDTDYEEYEFEDENEYEYKNLTRLPAKEKAVLEPVPKFRRVYSKWSKWTKCSPKCTTRRYKKCKIREQCGREVLREIAYCYTEGSFCQQWLHAQLQKSQPYEIRPVATRKKDSFGTSNAIASDFIMSGKGYRGPEYTPMKLKCGIAPVKSLKRNIYSMLKIIGGKAARKGEWPWQVAIFNRFKEAFCGGTLIAPQWVLTAAHCVRKVLYVRLGEHNLDYDDGSELQFRVAKSIKHPNFDKKTVDSDIALLRLPRPVNSTTWMGFSCLPRPFQPLPRNIDCTVIGWGKRRNRDQSGTSVLHQAEVPIIPMENCRSVYHDYTITKNMFCAGHKRGRIDTCAGDSGGPLLCRDSTKPNHPWTIFGITSFGDGCAKRNKFGIYSKVPNYVDWIWSVVNCNGNCKQPILKRY